MAQDAHSDRTNLAADLPACRTRKADFNTTQGDCSDTPQLRRARKHFDSSNWRSRRAINPDRRRISIRY